MAQEIEAAGVEYVKAADGRTLALVIRNNFDDYAAFPPYLDSEEERAHLAEAYSGADPETERRTKAHMTPDENPLQIVMLNRNPGSRGEPALPRGDGASHEHDAPADYDLPLRKNASRGVRQGRRPCGRRGFRARRFDSHVRGAPHRVPRSGNEGHRDQGRPFPRDR